MDEEYTMGSVAFSQWGYTLILGLVVLLAAITWTKYQARTESSQDKQR